MSFITKRERVFNDYDLYDIPARNEGKLKAYASCTDARAWSHFCSDKSEHLVEIIKRNNDTCRPKYVPTEAIVDTLMVGKNAEIAKLQRKIEEFEQMIAAYDDLDLTCDQKCEIAKAHAAIQAANKELDDHWFDLDLSTFTDPGPDSEAFETGKSRGDEPSRIKNDDDETARSKGDETSYFLSQWTFERENTEPIQKDTKSNQVELSCPCDASTNADDPRIQEMEDTIVAKDAKLNAMKNTIAVMENDVCEPYGIYAHIYTALEKIFGILCQNDKYRLYLDLMTSGRDTRCIDIKGKILFKLKVLEKFSLALIAPCSQDFASPSTQDCSCFRAEIVMQGHNINAYALTSAESKQPTLDNKRAQLVADIMEHDEMKEILSKENDLKSDLETEEEDIYDYNIDNENLKRLKNLQENFDDLMTCYETSKHEKDCLLIRCRKYEELEKEFEGLKVQLREYSALWNEKEHYKKRSTDLDTSLSHLKEQFLVLSDETSNLEAEVKAEAEINKAKCKTIEDLRRENLQLEEKLNNAAILFEKEKNQLQCMLKESDCKAMCQEQQIKSLSVQIDRLLEHEPEKDSDQVSLALKNEINALEEQIVNLKEVCSCNEEEKRQIEETFEDKLKLVNYLKLQVENWQSSYEDIIKRNDALERYSENCRNEINRLEESNKLLTQDIDAKSTALADLISVIKHKSQEINRLSEDMEKRNEENNDLYKQIQALQESYTKSSISLHKEKTQAMQSLQLARQESQELLEKVKDYDEIVHKKDDLATSFQSQNEEYSKLKSLLDKTLERNNSLELDLNVRESSNSILRQEIQRISDENKSAVRSIANLENDKNKYKMLNELSIKESKTLHEKLEKFEDLSEEMQRVKDSYNKLLKEKENIEKELNNKTKEFEESMHSLQLQKQESNELLHKISQSESLKSDLLEVNDAYKRLSIEKQALQRKLTEKINVFDNLFLSFDNLQSQNELKCQEVENLNRELANIKNAYEKLFIEKNILQSDFDNKSDEINNLHNKLEKKIEENRMLSQRIANMELGHESLTSNLNSLLEKNNLAKKENDKLLDKVNNYEMLESEYETLKKEYSKVQKEKENLEQELSQQESDLRRMKRENHDLNSQSQELLSQSEVLEKALINARTELIEKSSFPENSFLEMTREIEKLKKEKFQQHNKIRDLFDKLDESENTISNMSEVIMARNDRISILENHINQLEDEVRKLHLSLAEVVNTGEQISEYSSQKINQSLLSMEAHQSRATHNMKMELAKLQSENTMLEEKLSTSKLRNEEKHNYLSQISHLRNEREIIVTDIKQLEMRSVGDSALSPDKCSVEDVLGSLDRIRRFLDDRSSKSTTLEQTLLSVQNSYQLVQSKTDEAKKIVEKERHKIINEKEEAIKEKVLMEKQLYDLKKQLQLDQTVIKDLEAEILNRKLIIDKLNQSTQSYISKLEGDLKSLQDLYQNSLNENNVLETKIRALSGKESNHMSLIEKISKDLEEKIEEIGNLRKSLAELKKEPGRNASMQTSGTPTNRNVEAQTDIETKYDDVETQLYKEKYDDLHIEIEKINKVKHNNNNFTPDENQVANEVQILTASIDPSFNYVKNSYLNYKLKQLSTGRLEQYTISCGSGSDVLNEGISTPVSVSQFLPKPGSSKENTKKGNLNVIDIFNKKSMHTNSSKAIDNNDTEYEIEANGEPNKIKSPNKSSLTFTGFGGLTNESFGTESNINNEYKNSQNLFGSTSEVSTDKDLFIIYKDSESNHDDKSYRKKGPWKSNGQSEIVVEAMTFHSNNSNQKHIKNRRLNTELNNKGSASETLIYAENEEYEDDDSVKHKLEISLPRVENESPSIGASDADKRSLDSYTMAIYPSTKANSSSSYHDDNRVKFREDETKTQVSHEKHQNTLKAERPRNSDYQNEVLKSDNTRHSEQTTGNRGRKSHHKLSRVEADVLLIKSDKELNEKSLKQMKSGNFGLDYILDSLNDPNNIKTYNAAKAVRKTRSDVRLNLKKLEESDSSPTRISEFNKSSTHCKTESSNSYSQSTEKRQKYFNECSVMAKLDTVEEYENKIQHLTRTLENIEKDYKKKINAIKMQYDNNIKSILNEHNQGVESIQSLHEETLQDILKIHENEVENLRSMSIEAMRKADKLEKENKSLKTKMINNSTSLDEEPTKIPTPELRPRKRSRIDPRLLTKTTVEAFNLKPKSKSYGPCTCALDVNISDTIRNIFEQVDVEQRKKAEYTYTKYIANKILNGNVDALDTQELSFLHLKVCRIWKAKLTKEESLQKRIDSLEAELLNKQKHTQQNIAELDRKVAEERRRLQEVREAVCRNAPEDYVPPVPPPIAEKDFLNACAGKHICERISVDDITPVPSGLRPKRTRNESNRAVLAKLDIEERREREKKNYTDELPTRLRKSHDRPTRSIKK